MTKMQFIDCLLINGIEYLTVISIPDWNGGYRHVGLINQHVDYEELRDFEYIVWEGDASQIVKSRKTTFLDHYEPFHEEAYDDSISIEEMILCAIEN